jgi:hypothetical protein
MEVPSFHFIFSITTHFLTFPKSNNVGPACYSPTNYRNQRQFNKLQTLTTASTTMSWDEPMLDIADQVRQSLTTLSQAVREMTPSGAKPTSANPDRFNFLARPVHNGCRVCGLPGHASTNINKAELCRTALLSLITFWEDIAEHISFLYQHSERFQKAIVANAPTYAMRLDNGPVRGGDMEIVLVDGLTKNFLKSLTHVRGVRAKVNVVLGEEVARLDGVGERVGGVLLGGLTCKCMRKVKEGDKLTYAVSDLYEKSIKGGQ